MDPLGSWTSESQNFILEIVQFAIKCPYASGNFTPSKHMNITVIPDNAKSSYYLEDKLRLSHQILHISPSAFILAARTDQCTRNTSHDNEYHYQVAGTRELAKVMD